MERQDSAQQFKPTRTPASRRTFQVAALVLTAIAGLVVIACWRVPEDEAASRQGGDETASAKAFARLFGEWGKPDLALLLSAQQHGYLQPCGCSKPQYGGLTRRYNFLQMLKSKGWSVTALDLGDIPQERGIQKMLKYTTSMKALRKMNYAAVGIGKYEMGMPLIEALAHFALNNPDPPALASNLLNKDKDQPFDGLVKSWIAVDNQGKLKVGIIGAVGPSVEGKVKDPDVKFEKGPKVLPQMVKQIQARKPNFLVLLYQGSLEEAQNCAKFIKDFDVILCLSAEEEPPSVPEQVGKTSIVTLGHKGRYVGVMGIYRTGKPAKPFELRYQLVALGEEFNTPKGMEKGHPIMDLMEDYAREVKRSGFLAQEAVQKRPHLVQDPSNFPKSVYVGSQKCKKCHDSAYEIWAASPHANAYDTLAKAKKPSLRQYDSECIKCHVTGWEYKSGFMDEKKTAYLKDNGCENCHGPCSEHVKFPDDQKIRDVINPYRFNPKEKPADRVRRINLIDQSCQKCHDIENDVKWQIEKWWKNKTGPIVHSDDVWRPKKKAPK